MSLLKLSTRNILHRISFCSCYYDTQMFSCSQESAIKSSRRRAQSGQALSYLCLSTIHLHIIFPGELFILKLSDQNFICICHFPMAFYILLDEYCMSDINIPQIVQLYKLWRSSQCYCSSILLPLSHCYLHTSRRR